MPPSLCVLTCILVTTARLSLSSDGFMQDFFQRFPHLPFGNLNSFKYLHDQGSMPVTNSLISANDKFPFRDEPRDNNKYLRNRVADVKSNDRTASNEISTPTTKKSEKPKPTTKITLRNKKKLFAKKPNSASSSTSNSSARKNKKKLFSKYPKTTVKSLTKKPGYNNFRIVSTTPSYGQKNSLPEFGTSKIKEMRNSFFSYSDKHNSQYFLYPQDKDFHTQLLRPKLMSDSKYFAYDPFLQNPAGRTEAPPTVTLEKHFYYGDTTTMRPPAKYKIRRQKLKKGIVITEKAVSGEVHNIAETEEPPPPVTTTTTTTTTATTIETTAATAAPPPPTTSTTTLSPSSVSELPAMVVSELPRARPPGKYHYKLTTPHPRPEPGPGLVYSPLSYSQYDFHEFLPPHAAPGPAPPRLKYMYTTTEPPAAAAHVVMPPYTPAPNKTAPPELTPAPGLHNQSRHATHDSSINPGAEQVTGGAGGGGGAHELDIDENNTSSHTADPRPGHHNKYAYRYKLRGAPASADPSGPGSGPREPYVPVYPPPPPLYAPRPRPYPFLPPLSAPHYPPHPSYNVQESPEHKQQQFMYHSKIKYMPKEDKDKLKYKYTSRVNVKEDKFQKYLPHNKIIKATFFEDEELKNNVKIVEEASEPTVQEDTLEKPISGEDKPENHDAVYYKPQDRSLRSSKLIGSKYNAIDRMQHVKENRLFKHNLEQLRSHQFQIQPSDFMSGFLPLQDQAEISRSAGKLSATGSRNLGNSRNTKLYLEQRTSSVPTSTTTTRPLPATNTHIDNVDEYQRRSDLRDNYSVIRKENQRNDPRKQNILQLILRKYKNKHLDNKSNVLEKKLVQKPSEEIVKEKSVSPIQSIKESLFGRFLKYFQSGSVKESESKVSTTPPSVTEESQESRIPQTFLINFARQKKFKDTSPPSSQDSYKNFLLKLGNKKGRNES